MRAGLLLALLGLACATPGPEFALLYNPAASHHGPERNPIIAIPGILGSKLIDRPTGVLAWGAFEPGAADPADPDGARLIALPVDGEQDLLLGGADHSQRQRRARIGSRFQGRKITMRCHEGRPGI